MLRGQVPPSVSVALDCPPPPLLALGEAEEVERIVLNLCRNGVQAMTDMRPPEERRGGRLSIRLEREGLASLRLSVSDEGVGIAPDVLPRLFTPFFTTKGGHGGTGLGLAASKAIAEAYGGRIEAESRPEGGARFSLILPAAP